MTFWNKTITIYHKEQNSPKWARNVYNGCFFKQSSMLAKGGNEHSKAHSVIIRIPCDVTAEVGDYAFLGSVEFPIDESVKGQRMSDYKGIEIAEVDNNMDFPIPHTALRGD